MGQTEYLSEMNMDHSKIINEHEMGEFLKFNSLIIRETQDTRCLVSS